MDSFGNAGPSSWLRALGLEDPDVSSVIPENAACGSQALG